MRAVIQDGELRPDGRVLIDVDDQGLTRGLAAFETLRTYGGRIDHVDDHLERLARSAEVLRLPMPGRRILREEVVRAVNAVGGEVAVRITLTEGSRIVHATQLPAAPPSIRAVTRRHPDHPWLSGRVKHASRAASLVALRQAEVDEVLWVDAEGLLLEGTWSNVFGVRDGALLTPPDDGRILAGVTRKHVLATARELDLPCHEEPMDPRARWDELYTSSSLKLLCPIVELDGAAAPGDGPVGRQVLEALQARFRSLQD